jgi:hypothetical protein
MDMTLGNEEVSVFLDTCACTFRHIFILDHLLHSRVTTMTQRILTLLYVYNMPTADVWLSLSAVVAEMVSGRCTKYVVAELTFDSLPAWLPACLTT